MKIQDILEETYSALISNKVRSGLTMLGIIIGIASVIVMVSIGSGVQNSVQSSIESLGSNLLTISPGAAQQGNRAFVSEGRGSIQSLKNEDAEAIKGVSEVAYVSPEFQRRFQVSSTVGNNTNTTIIGAVSDYPYVHNILTAQGSFISEQNNLSMARVAVIGTTVAADLFGDNIDFVDIIGKSIRINKVDFKIIGILQEKGGSAFSSSDSMIFIPLSTMQKILTGSDYLSNISVNVSDKNKMQDVKNQITALLLEKHNVAEADFSVISQEDILSSLNQITATLTIFLASIAGISLLVGGIGIMNMMLTAVTERTREIGLRKAIGAKKHDITLQFLTESIFLTFFGGVIGVGLGWLISVLVSRFAGINTLVSFQSIILAFGVSAVIGIVFGYYPSRRAAGLNPIEALRYE